jgi:hypothetical protein
MQGTGLQELDRLDATVIQEEDEANHGYVLETDVLVSPLRLTESRGPKHNEPDETSMLFPFPLIPILYHST